MQKPRKQETLQKPSSRPREVGGCLPGLSEGEDRASKGCCLLRFYPGPRQLGLMAKRLQYSLGHVKSGEGFDDDYPLKLPANEHGPRELRPTCPTYWGAAEAAFDPQGLGPSWGGSPVPLGLLLHLPYKASCDLGLMPTWVCCHSGPGRHWGQTRAVIVPVTHPTYPLPSSPLRRGFAESPEDTQQCGG